MKNTSFHKQTRKVAAVSASMLVAATMLPAALMTEPAFAATETRTITWRNGEAQPAIPQTIQGANGQTLTLSGQSAPRQIGSGGTVSQKFNETRTGRCNDKSEVASAVPGKVSINRDGYSGDIPRTSVSYDPIYHDEQRMEEDNAEAYGPTEDAARSALPATITRNGRTLSPSGAPVVTAVRWDSAGRPTTYRAICTYTATYTEPVLQYYQVTATYSGTLTKRANNGDWTMSLTYTGPDTTEENRDENRPEDENRDEDKDKKVDYWINYFREGTTDKIASTQHVTDRPVDSEVEAEAIDIEGYELVGDKTQKLVLKEGINEINFYYKQVEDENANITPIENTNETSEFINGNSLNTNRNEPDETAADEPEDEGGIPIVPIAIAGAVALCGVAAGIVIVKRRKKNDADDMSEIPMEDVASMSDPAYAATPLPVESATIDGYELDSDTVITYDDEFADFADGMGDAELSDFDAAAFAPAAAAMEEIIVPEPIQVDIYEGYEPQSQLIELILREETDAIGNVTMTYDQIPKAEIEVIPSVDESIPTVLYLPGTTDEEGNRIVPVFVPADNAQYWIAIDEETVNRAPSKMVILATDEGDEIFRGDLADENGNIVQQIQLDSDLLVAALNNTLEEGQADNIAEELAEYEDRSDEILNARAQAAEQREQEIADALAAIEAQKELMEQQAAVADATDDEFGDFANFTDADNAMDGLDELDELDVDDFSDDFDDVVAADETDGEFGDFAETDEELSIVEADEFSDFSDYDGELDDKLMDSFDDVAEGPADADLDDIANDFADVTPDADSDGVESPFADFPAVTTEDEMSAEDAIVEADISEMSDEEFDEPAEDEVSDEEFADMLVESEDDEDDAFPDFADALPELLEPEATETFDSDFEKEMDDFDGFAYISEPDADEGYDGEPSGMTPAEQAEQDEVATALAELDEFDEFDFEDFADAAEKEATDTAEPEEGDSEEK